HGSEHDTGNRGAPAGAANRDRRERPPRGLQYAARHGHTPLVACTATPSPLTSTAPASAGTNTESPRPSRVAPSASPIVSLPSSTRIVRGLGAQRIDAPGAT